MTFPSGAPGGYPGQGPQQPQQGPGYGPPSGGTKLGLPQILALVTAGLGLLNLFLGFATIAGGSSFYETSFGWVPAMLFAGGLFVLPAVLPGEENKKAGIYPAATLVAVTFSFLFFVFASSGELKAGGIMVLIFGILQTGAAVAGYLFEAGIIKPPAPNPYGHPGSPYPHTGGFQQPGQFGQQQQQTQQTQHMQPQQQPGQFPQQPPGQQTMFAPQQGQFGQQPGAAGAPGGPGTPPGGQPQQPPQG